MRKVETFFHKSTSFALQVILICHHNILYDCRYFILILIDAIEKERIFDVICGVFRDSSYSRRSGCDVTGTGSSVVIVATNETNLHKSDLCPIKLALKKSC